MAEMVCGSEQMAEFWEEVEHVETSGTQSYSSLVVSGVDEKRKIHS